MSSYKRVNKYTEPVFWFNNPMILLSDPNDYGIALCDEMTFTDRLNAITRQCILMYLFLYVLGYRPLGAIMSIVSVVVIIIIYYSIHPFVQVQKESFTEINGNSSTHHVGEVDETKNHIDTVHHSVRQETYNRPYTAIADIIDQNQNHKDLTNGSRPDVTLPYRKTHDNEKQQIHMYNNYSGTNPRVASNIDRRAKRIQDNPNLSMLTKRVNEGNEARMKYNFNSTYREDNSHRFAEDIDKHYQDRMGQVKQDPFAGALKHSMGRYSNLDDDVFNADDIDRTSSSRKRILAENKSRDIIKDFRKNNKDVHRHVSRRGPHIKHNSSSSYLTY